MRYTERIVRDSNICSGEPVIKGTRIPVKTILVSLADGDTIEAIMKDFPTLKEEDILSVIEKWQRCLVVATDRKIRIKYPER